MNRPRPRPAALVLLVMLPVGCRSQDPDLEPITAEDLVEWQERENAPKNLVKIEHAGTLFTTLDQNLRSWRQLQTSDDPNSLLRLESLEEALTRLVYNNFDRILAELREGDPDNRVTAAGALGFSRIPAPHEPGGDAEHLQVHTRAVEPLLNALESGNDLLTQNALLSLGRIASADTPVELFLEILVTHHNPEVRSNAGYALSRILVPKNRDLATGSLYAALEDKEQKVRLHALTAIGRLRDPNSMGQVLGVYTDDESPLVRANAAFVLGQLDNEQAIPYLIGGLSDAKPVIRYYSRVALKNLTGEDQGEDAKAWVDWYRRRQREGDFQKSS